MATSTSAQEKPAARRKAAPASRKPSPAEQEKGGKRLQFRFHTVMKPQRVYALVVQVPKPRKGVVSEGEGVVVVRPIIPGAQVVPAEQRLDVGTARNQITFHITPLARSRLPRARVEVHSAGQPPQIVLVPMKATTQRLAWALLVLAFVLPWFMTKITRGNWRPAGVVKEEVTRGGEVVTESRTDPAAVLGFRIKSTLGHRYEKSGEALDDRDAVFPAQIPVFNTPVDSLPWGLDKFTLSGGLGSLAEVGYAGLDEGVRKSRWAALATVGCLLLAFLSWMMHRPRRVTLRRSVKLSSEAAEGEPVTLQPM